MGAKPTSKLSISQNGLTPEAILTSKTHYETRKDHTPSFTHAPCLAF